MGSRTGNTLQTAFRTEGDSSGLSRQPTRVTHSVSRKSRASTSFRLCLDVYNNVVLIMNYEWPGDTRRYVLRLTAHYVCVCPPLFYLSSNTNFKTWQILTLTTFFSERDVIPVRKTKSFSCKVTNHHRDRIACSLKKYQRNIQEISKT